MDRDEQQLSLLDDGHRKRRARRVTPAPITKGAGSGKGSASATSRAQQDQDEGLRVMGPADIMRHPLFALSSGKPGETFQWVSTTPSRELNFTSTASRNGAATIFDLTLFMTAITVLDFRNRHVNASQGPRSDSEAPGQLFSSMDDPTDRRKLRVRLDDFMELIGEGVGQGDIDRLNAALVRLSETSIRFTSHALPSKRLEFMLTGHWLAEATYHGHDPINGTPRHIEFLFTDWTMDFIAAQKMMHLSPAVKKIRGAFERRLATMLECRALRINYPYRDSDLQHRCAPTMEIREFRRAMRALVRGQGIHEHGLKEDPKGFFIFMARQVGGERFQSEAMSPHVKTKRSRRKRALSHDLRAVIENSVNLDMAITKAPARDD